MCRRRNVLAQRTLVTCLIVSTAVRSLFVWVRGFAFFMLLAIAAYAIRTRVVGPSAAHHAAPLSLTSEFISSPVSSLLDSGVLAILGPTETKKYGQQRLFGAIGCAPRP